MSGNNNPGEAGGSARKNFATGLSSSEALSPLMVKIILGLEEQLTPTCHGGLPEDMKLHWLLYYLKSW